MDLRLETERLLLRPLTRQDIPGLFALDSDPEVHRFLGNQPVHTLAEVEAILADIHWQYATHGVGRLALIEKTSGDFVGWSGLKYETVVRPDFPYYDLGYRLRRQYWGRGLATEAARASLRYGFLDLQLSDIYAAAQAAHQASNHILGLKLGMTRSETFTFQGIPCYWYQLGRTQWQASPPHSFTHT